MHYFCRQLLLFIIYLHSEAVSQILEGFRTVKTEQGFVKGRIWRINETQVQVFLGIPYAEPPTGRRRFQKPAKKEPWLGDLLALDYGPPCFQFMDFHTKDRYSGENMKRQGEDCLYLNVFSPFKPESADKFPVLVWIHGGSFLAGSSDTGMDLSTIVRNIISRGVVLVTLNYRLGPLGFLATLLPSNKGNFGLWDQIEALLWTRKNIAEFSGNPNSVTIMGESAGAASASVLAISPISKDLIHGAIMMSGSYAAGWAVTKERIPAWSLEKLFSYLTCKEQLLVETQQLAILLDFESNGHYECNFMKKPMDCEDSLNSYEKFQCLSEKADFSDPTMRRAYTMALGLSEVVIDGEIIPYDLENWLNKRSRIPVMIGTAAAEWGHKKAIYYGFDSYFDVGKTSAWDLIRQIMEQSAKPYLNFPTDNETLDIITDATFFHYALHGVNQKKWEMANFVHVLQKVESDIEFVAPMHKEVNMYNQANQTVYVYEFDYAPSGRVIEEEWTNLKFFGMMKTLRIERSSRVKKAYHGLDHAFIFTEGYSSNTYFTYDQNDRQLADTWSTLIMNFVKYGDPTPTTVMNVKWLPSDSARPCYLRISLPLQMMPQLYRWKKATFWNDFVPKLLQHSTLIVQRSRDELTEDERLQLAAFKRAWWALWVLVAGIAFLLWTIIICIIAQKCLDAHSKHYKNVIVAEDV
ncbi:unnamed protein product [Soboliphyme baturini]|uniref:COesterase domain-containing protein n=1 Tax=Soboliphyme baturini TaxID=241478 RepID=A0A183IP80_9BILA|nr:unnamed protein product [Soboliphyme baturini]